MTYILLLLAFLIPTGLAVLCLYRVGRLLHGVDSVKLVVSALKLELSEQESKITAIARQRNIVLTENKCEVCGSVLDETVARTHDGHYLCAEHKAANKAVFSEM